MLKVSPDLVGESCKESLNSAHSSSVGYRIMDALRNHSQHYGFPISIIMHSMERRGGPERTITMSTIACCAEPSRIAENSKFKKKVLEEMQAIGKKVDLKPLIREYIGELAGVHYQFRKQIESSAKAWEASIQGGIDIYLNAFPEEHNSAIHATKVDDTGRTENFYLTEEFRKYRMHLSRKNGSLRNIERVYASGEPAKI